MTPSFHEALVLKSEIEDVSLNQFMITIPRETIPNWLMTGNVCPGGVVAIALTQALNQVLIIASYL
jgi:hypothetical protein